MVVVQEGSGMAWASDGWMRKRHDGVSVVKRLIHRGSEGFE
jgi:hypothetical protein